jgi:hypothetical protein
MQSLRKTYAHLSTRVARGRGVAHGGKVKYEHNEYGRRVYDREGQKRPHVKPEVHETARIHEEDGGEHCPEHARLAIVTPAHAPLASIISRLAKDTFHAHKDEQKPNYHGSQQG